MDNNHQNNLQRTVNLFKIYSDYTRLRIIDLLTEAEHCVQDIANTLETSQSAISHQLKQLRDNNVVSARKEGKQVFYSLKDNHIKEIFLTAVSHITECDD
ncbi:MAG: metalloregulator ArsR/SmtB family transcription factor [Candidatus Izimaplasma sp.]|nr:metalloregulator ArsR/SmtB family transcription factor [Candidatus Izimaplasma bacterium]